MIEQSTTQVTGPVFTECAEILGGEVDWLASFDAGHHVLDRRH
jgi:hypothetical protein